MPWLTLTSLVQIAYPVTNLQVDKNFKNRYEALLSKNRIDFDQQIGRVEVVGRDDNIQCLYFPRPVQVLESWLRPEVQLNMQVLLRPDNMSRRTNPEEKIKSFLEDSKDLIRILDHEYKLHEWLHSTNPLKMSLAWLGQMSRNVGTLVLVLSFLINLALLFDNVTTHSDPESLEGVVTGFVEKYQLPFVHLIFTVINLVAHTVTTGWRDVRAGREDNVKREISFQPTFFFTTAVLVTRTPRYVFRKILCCCGSKPEAEGKDGDYQGPDHERPWTPLWLLMLSKNRTIMSASDLDLKFQPNLKMWEIALVAWDYFRNLTTSWVVLLVIISALGATWEPLLFSLAILDVPRHSTLMQYVLRSFTNNFGQLMYTYLFLLIALYIFACWAFRNKYEYSFEDRSPRDELWSYFFLHFDYGFMNPMVWNPEPGVDDDGTEIGNWHKSVANLLYVFIVQIVLVAIISGIIIDTFAEMRLNRKDVEADLHSNCFVCSIEPEEFEEQNVTYTEHIKVEHNIWNYLWLQIHLRDKKRTDFRGVEFHVFEGLQKKNPRCFPIKRARCLHKKIKEKANLANILDNTKNVMNRLRSHEVRKRLQQSTSAWFRVKNFENIKLTRLHVQTHSQVPQAP